jgi:fatty-acyl-CoA synthase
VRLLDDDGQPVPDGEVGRVFVGNALPFEGYTGHGGSNGQDGKDLIDGLMPTGDVGRWRDGLLFVEGRDDEMIVSGGENIYPAEVDDCLARDPDVADVAVVGVDDADYGQRLQAFVVRSGGSSLDKEQVKAYVKSELARYKVPRDVAFVDELLRNATGRVLKREHVETEAGG